jgi:3-hydroxy-3-methylglutaryl CoA synthase/uncharacterized OB-fold protein
MSTSYTAARLVAVGTYLPAHRLSRSAFGNGDTRETRAVANYDEDTTSLGVEAARSAITSYGGTGIDDLFFATSLPAYSDKTNATIVHAAIGLPSGCTANDIVGSVHASVTAIRAAASSAGHGHAGMAVLADIRTGLPGSIDERAGGDGAAALVFAPHGPCLAHLVAHASATAEFLDRWRIPGESSSRMWEERFGESVYTSLAKRAFADALQLAGAAASDVAQLLVTGPNLRAVSTTARTAGVDPRRVAPDLGDSVGITGAAHPGLLLVDVLDRTKPGDLVALLVLADAADCLLFRTGEAIAEIGKRPRVRDQLKGTLQVDYQDFLVWRGMLKREPPRRPPPDRPAAPPSFRNSDWKFGFVASRCLKCGTRHLPPARVCLQCHAIDQMAAEPLSNTTGTITTFAIDHLAFSVAPPVIAAVVDLDGGGRLQCQHTDCNPQNVSVGDRVRLTFRRLYTTVDGVNNYFWKATPLIGEK